MMGKLKAYRDVNDGRSMLGKSIFLLMMLLSVFSVHSFAVDGQTLMNTAKNAYNEGLYDSAINIYQQIENEQLESAALYYNMGNAYFKQKNIPAAILYYEKARKLTPNDQDIDYNLSIANSMIVDKIEKVPELFFKKWWNYFYNMFDADTWAVLFIVSWAILIFLIGMFILARSRGGRKLAFYLGLIFIFSTLATFGLASQKYYYTKQHNQAIIFTPTITVKSSPTLNAVDLFVVHEGTKVHILDHVEEWVKIRIQDGSIGWLPANSMKEI